MDPVTMDALIPMGLMQSPLGVVMFDAELRVAWVNEAAERLSGGMLTNRWLGRRLGELLPDMDADLIEQSLRRVLATGEPVVDLEVSSRAGGDLSGGDRGNSRQNRSRGLERRRRQRSGQALARQQPRIIFIRSSERRQRRCRAAAHLEHVSRRQSLADI